MQAAARPPAHFQRMRVTAIAWALVAGCGGSGSMDPGRIDSLYGEVHIHQFAEGSHLSALFVRTPVAAAAVDGDEILPSLPPNARDGACTLTQLDPAALPSVPALSEAGVVHLDGDRAVELVWDGALMGYRLSQPLSLSAPAFAGGVTVQVTGDGGAAPAFAGSVTTPPPLELTTPRALALGDVGDLAIAWMPAHADVVTIDLVVSTDDGRAAQIHCVADDAAGALAVPRTLLSGVPARPRDLQLMVSRDQIVRAPSHTARLGVILHAGWEAALAAHEP
jgi:hypothetical protein